MSREGNAIAACVLIDRLEKSPLHYGDAATTVARECVTTIRETVRALSAAESDSAAARQIRMFAVGRRVNGCASSANSCSA